MTKISLKTDCGHSPKREFLKDFNVAFGKGNVKFLTENVTEDVIWDMIGDKTIEGKDDYSNAINKMKDKKVSELVIEKIVTHGKEGAVSGIMKMQNGKKYAFSDFYEFSGAKGAKVKSIISYVIEI